VIFFLIFLAFHFLGLELGWLGWCVVCVGWGVRGLTRAKPGNCTSSICNVSAKEQNAAC
jgi:hypothetical protein